MMKLTAIFLTALLLAPLAASHAPDNPSPRDDAAWLRQKGTLIFADTFDREEWMLADSNPLTTRVMVTELKDKDLTKAIAGAVA